MGKGCLWMGKERGDFSDMTGTNLLSSLNL